MIDEQFLALKFPAGSFATAVWEKVRQPPNGDVTFMVDRLDLTCLFFGPTQEAADKRAEEWIATRVVPASFTSGQVKMEPADA